MKLNINSKWRSIRFRILILVLCPLLLMASVLAGVMYFWVSESGYRHLLMKVSTDLAVASKSLHNTQEHYSIELALQAQSTDFRTEYLDFRSTPPSPHKLDKLRTELRKMQLNSGLDYIQLLTPKGCLALKPTHCDDAVSPLLKQALSGRAVSGIEIYSAQQLTALSPTIAKRAHLTLTKTERATPSDRTFEDRGMILRLLHPLTNQRGEVFALLSGGVLMNGNTAIVDQIKETVYSAGSLAFDSVGTVTIFLDDVRISTNVPALQKPSTRALGTRVSKQVKEKVLVQGERWLDRAFVVSDWYISGYLPISDVYGERVGMIYAGFLEAPFKRDFYQLLWSLSIVFGCIVLICGLLVVLGAKSIFKPIESMVTVIGQIRSGQRQRITIPDSTSSELRSLGIEFNLMLDLLEQQHDHIQGSAQQLEHTVSQRTKALNQHIKLLQSTREQLISKEKLAAIGELTAGIAHEINNPTAVILGYLDLMAVELGEQGEQVSDELEIIVQQVERIRSIINDLLQFSRPGEYTSPIGEVDINETIKATHVLIKHDLEKNNIQLNMDLKACPTTASNRQQMQQVLINLITNAVAACSTDGRITIRSRVWKDTGVIITVRDNGCGIPKALTGRIFDPFFSRTQGGSGLGLSVSYSILQGLNAQIAVRSRVEVGSVFHIWLPKYSADYSSNNSFDPFTPREAPNRL